MLRTIGLSPTSTIISFGVLIACSSNTLRKQSVLAPRNAEHFQASHKLFFLKKTFDISHFIDELLHLVIDLRLLVVQIHHVELEGECDGVAYHHNNK